MRRKSVVDSQNLDSLLDTMANVVGILVVILAVTQITVGEAMKNIRALEDEAAIEHARAVERSAEFRLEMDELEEKLDALDEAGARSELDALQKAWTELRRAKSGELEDASPAAVSAALARESQRAKRLEQQVASSSSQLASLRISLQNMPDIGSAKTVRLPDPRPAPRGTQPAAFYVRYERIFRVDLDDLKAKLVAAFANPLARANFPDVGSAELRWQPLPPRYGRLGARLAWRDRRAGETASQIAAKNSAFRRDLLALHPKRQTVLFYVWPDSYDVYLQAREIASDAGYLAGWEALDAEQESDWWQSREREVRESAVPID